MKILIIYGGNGLADDLSLAAVSRVHTVLNELEVSVKQFNLNYNDITQNFLDELQSADGVVLATTVDWIGIGGRMQTFLDGCYFSGRREVFSGKYLMSVVLTKSSGDRDATNYLIKSWDMLGGVEGVNVCGKIDKFVELETNQQIISIIDRKTEDFYRVLNQKRDVLPTGTGYPMNAPLQTPNEGTISIINEVVGDYSNFNNQLDPIEEDPFIAKQRQDIEELADFFKQKLSTDDISPGTNGGNKYINILQQAFTCNTSFNCTYNIILTDKNNQDITLKIENGKMTGFIGNDPTAEVIINIDSNTFDRIISGKLTAQRGFLTGQLKAKGNFTLLYEFDNLFKL